MKKLFLCCLSLLCLTNTLILAQIKDPKIEDNQNIPRAKIVVHTKGGEVYKGFFISQNKDFLEIETESAGTITISTQRIKSIQSLEAYESSVGEASRHVNPTRYMLGTSAFNYKKGENYIRNNPSTYHRGFTDNFSLGVGTSVYALAIGAPSIYINPLFTTPIGEYVHFKVGLDAFTAFVFGEGNFSAAILNSGVTIGEPDLNLTGTVYYGAVSDAERLNPFYSLAGMARISRSLMIVTEGFYIPTTNDLDIGFVFYGGRYNSEKASYDFGFFYNREIAEFLYVGIPFFAYTFRF